MSFVLGEWCFLRGSRLFLCVTLETAGITKLMVLDVRTRVSFFVCYVGILEKHVLEDVGSTETLMFIQSGKSDE